MAVLTLAFGLYFLLRPAYMQAPEPLIKTPLTPTAPTLVSSINIPVTIDLDFLAKLANKAVPRTLEPQKTEKSETLDLTANVQLTREDIVLNVADDRLHGRAAIQGRATLTAHAGQIRMNKTVDLKGEVFISFRPMITENWEMDAADLQISYDLDEANVDFSLTKIVTQPVQKIVEELDFVGIVSEITETVFETVERPLVIRISVREIARDYIDPRVKQYEDELTKAVQEANVLKPIAKEVWQDLCRTTAVVNDVWLHSKPVKFRVAQPQLRKAHILAELGLDIELLISPVDAEFDCPFDGLLIVEDEMPAHVKLSVPAQISYETVEAALKKAIFQESIEIGNAITVYFDSLSLKPGGDSLLVELNLTVSEDKRFFFDVSGTIYMWVVPELSKDNTLIKLAHVRLDTDSESALFHLVGELGEPRLITLLEGYSFDLEPTYSKIELVGTNALTTFSSEDFQTSGTITDVRLETLDLGPKSINLHGLVLGSIEVELK